ncbi:hypothetical protein B0H21DRAFT_703047 [Amylocystis lapponica]|nr:hypothetical protein B0H21DRAFT_703047 [Amylocystis lapponica]
MSQVDVLRIEPKTRNEVALLAALREAESQVTFYKRRTMELQAMNILNESYCKTLLDQLAFQEEKKGQKKEKGKLMGDGLPVLLSGDWFFERVVEFEAWQQQEGEEKAARLATREGHRLALEEYRVQVEARKEQIAARRAEWAEEKRQWEEEKEAAKAVKRKFSIPKPKLGKLPPVIPRPRARETGGDSGDELADVDADDDKQGDSD